MNNNYLNNIDTNDDSFELKAKQDKLNFLFQQSAPAVYFSIFAASLLLTILWSQVNTKILLIWLGVLLFSSLLRLVLFYKYRKLSINIKLINLWEKLYFFSLTFSVLTWGIGCSFFLPLVSVESQFIIYFYLMALAGGAISVYSAFRPLVLITTYSLLLPSSLWFLYIGDKTHLLTGVGCMLFLLANLRSTKILSETLDNSFILSYKLLKAKKQADILARKDFLTGLNNRFSFNDMSELQIKYCHRHSIQGAMIIMDVDFFKAINDTKGHHAGDEALKQISKVLVNSIRAADICGRIGGEEFAIFLPKTDAENALNVANKIKIRIASLVLNYQNEEFTVTASFGVYSKIDSLEKMLMYADTAMYEAKNTGRNKVIHYSDLQLGNE